MLAFGTDYPVEPITPFRGLYAAVTRKNEAGTKEYVPEQKISIDQAIAAYTTGAAYAEFAESEKGRLAPGFLADFVVLDRDITEGCAGGDSADQGAADGGGREDGVRSEVVCFSGLSFQLRPSGAKAQPIVKAIGTAEAVPFPFFLAWAQWRCMT